LICLWEYPNDRKLSERLHSWQKESILKERCDNRGSGFQPRFLKICPPFSNPYVSPQRIENRQALHIHVGHVPCCNGEIEGQSRSGNQSVIGRKIQRVQEAPVEMLLER
jgi:hypothetical protein